MRAAEQGNRATLEQFFERVIQMRRDGKATITQETNEEELERLMSGPGDALPFDSHGASSPWEQPMTRTKIHKWRPTDADY